VKQRYLGNYREARTTSPLHPQGHKAQIGRPATTDGELRMEVSSRAWLWTHGTRWTLSILLCRSRRTWWRRFNTPGARTSRELCPVRCDYCAFVRAYPGVELVRRYVAAKSGVNEYRRTPGTARRRLYLGSGLSMLSPDQVARLLTIQDGFRAARRERRSRWERILPSAASFGYLWARHQPHRALALRALVPAWISKHSVEARGGAPARR